MPVAWPSLPAALIALAWSGERLDDLRHRHLCRQQRREHLDLALQRRDAVVAGGKGGERLLVRLDELAKRGGRVLLAQRRVLSRLGGLDLAEGEAEDVARDGVTLLDGQGRRAS